MSKKALLDTYCREINYLRVSVTDKCNLRCIYCMPPEGVPAISHSEILTFEEIERVVRLAVGMGITKVRLTGGEPLVRRGIANLIGDISSMEGVKDVSLTTNGILLAPMAAELKEKGLRRVNISLDTLKPDVFEKITGFPRLNEVLAGIEEARRVGLTPVKVNVVAIGGVNDGELLDFAKMAVEKGVEVRFIEHMPSRRDVWSDRSLVPASQILKTIGERYTLTPCEPKPGSRGPGRMYDIAGGGRIGVISPMSDHFCGSCNRLRLTSDGRLRTCLFSNAEIDLKKKLRDGSGDEAIAALLKQAVAAKPEKHGLPPDAEGHEGMDMSRIGG